MKTPERTKRWMVVLLAGWCLLFLHGENTQKSMVRVVYLEQQGAQWQVALLYQAPEAAADASDASAALQFAAGSGETLERAFSEAEAELPETANYRLCDYALFPEEAPDELLSAWETLILEQQCGRTAAHLAVVQFDLSALADACQKEAPVPEKLLDKLKEISNTMPRLYAHRQTMLLPVLDETFALAESSQLRTTEKQLSLPEKEAECFRLLAGIGRTHTLWLRGQKIEIRRNTVSVSLQKSGVLLRLDAQRAYGTPAPDAAQIQELERQCTELVSMLWEQGIDLLHLQQRYALQDAMREEIRPIKNACPQMQTDVRFLPV